MVWTSRAWYPRLPGASATRCASSAPETDSLRNRVLEARARARTEGAWILESCAGDGGLLQRTPIQPIPFRVGRAPDLELVLPSAHVSKTHAEIYSDGEALRVRDLGSRNGTFLNRQPVSDAALHRGDVLHFGDFELRIGSENGAGPETAEDPAAQTMVHTGPLSRQFATGAAQPPGDRSRNAR